MTKKYTLMEFLVQFTSLIYDRQEMSNKQTSYTKSKYVSAQCAASLGYFRVVENVQTISLYSNLIYTLGLEKRDLWGLGAESWFVVASYAFAKMIPPLEDHFGKSQPYCTNI